MCVPCTSDQSSLCSAPTPVCDPTTNRCVACVAPSDCPEPERSSCNLVTRRCDPCGSDADCAHVSGKGVCDEGTCVECTPRAVDACREATVGGESVQHVCDPTLRACDRSRRARSKRACEPCVSDLECVAGQLCVDVQAGAGARVCQPVATGSTACARPYVGGTDQLFTSADGQRAEVCTLGPETTCEAHRQYRNQRCGTPVRAGAAEDLLGSGNDARCGVEGREDGYCVWYENLKQYLCTVACRNNVADCPIDAPACTLQEHASRASRNLCSL